MKIPESNNVKWQVYPDDLAAMISAKDVNRCHFNLSKWSFWLTPKYMVVVDADTRYAYIVNTHNQDRWWATRNECYSVLGML